VAGHSLVSKHPSNQGGRSAFRKCTTETSINTATNLKWSIVVSRLLHCVQQENTTKLVTSILNEILLIYNNTKLLKHGLLESVCSFYELYVLHRNEINETETLISINAL
jgi:hypothetical protein